MIDYRTKWITLENDRQMFTFTHYKELDGNKILVIFYETKTGIGDTTHKEVMTADEANKLYKWLRDAKWKVTRNEAV